jgi:uncharacterized delta-60 repeat protein
MFRTYAVVRAAVAACLLLSLSVVGNAQAGSLDPTFGHRGIFSTNFATCCGDVGSIALQSDGKILVGGQAQITRLVGVVFRLNSNGTLDITFGTGGMVTISLGSIGATIGGLAVQPDGKIVASVEGVFVARGDVTRLNGNGSVDTSFGTNGIASISGMAPTGPIVLQPDGKILVAGKEFSSGLLARLNGNGQLDSSFGSNGVAVLLAPSSQLALLSSGQILAASASAPVQGVTRYNSNGTVDHAFGALGQAASTDAPASVVVQTNGAVLAAGMSITGVAAPTIFTGNPTGFGIMRFNSGGGIDTTFGTKGSVITAFSGMNIGGIAAIAVQTNGDIVAAGNAGFAPSNQSQFTSSFALARYVSGGQLDSTFGTAGRITTSFGSSNVAFIAAMAIQSDGKIVVAGETGDADGNIAVARYLAQ